MPATSFAPSLTATTETNTTITFTQQWVLQRQFSLPLGIFSVSNIVRKCIFFESQYPHTILALGKKQPVTNAEENDLGDLWRMQSLPPYSLNADKRSHIPASVFDHRSQEKSHQIDLIKLKCMPLLPSSSDQMATNLIVPIHPAWFAN